MGYSSNYSDFAKDLVGLSKTFNMRRHMHGDRVMGDEITDIAAAIIYERTRIHKLDPDLNPLPALKTSSIKRKVRKGFSPVLGVETGEMLEKAQIRGTSHTTDDTVALEYGLNPEAEDKAERFQEGRPGVQPERFFYDLGRDGEKAVWDYIDSVATEAGLEGS